ncbi:hypothetical protein [Deinococcus yavapaiensis]|uniref:Uncharacterized protein n=1 Tax=Deinococcus yavapaiensis KR-236 TaxID=694435 RepID=A0A318S8C8_9DEIO|nr:hypothetical protein [Deinococcus yavapaiensis]PYE51882.1 hypothetical protein DES52_11483 [Deinococcus yavapaiensis KR-236]
MTNDTERDEARQGKSGGDDVARRERELAHGEVPDRSETGGGPSLGVTTDGRTGPGHSTDNGPKSTLRVEHDFSGDGNLADSGKDRDLVDFADKASESGE